MPDPVMVAGIVLKDKNGRCLLVKERKVDAYGLWNLPAGHVDADETPQQAAVREGFEETGFKVKLISKEPLLVDAEKNLTKYAFSAEITSGKLAFPEEELLDAQWLTVDDIKRLDEQGKIRSPWVMNAVLQMVKA